MATYPVMQVDAFTDKPLNGNPCAVVFETDQLDEAVMLAVSREMNLSETAFVRDSPIADFGVRFFTPAEEIPLAGHPTIATVFALIDSGRLKLTDDFMMISLELKHGPIPVEIFSKNGSVQQIVMNQRKPEFFSKHDPKIVLPIFGLTEKELLADFPIQTVSTGTRQLMVPLRSLEALRAISFNVTAYEEFRAKADFFSPHLFCLRGITEEGMTFARHFGCPPDLPEDPFTGSATGGMAAYLWHYGLIEQPKFTAEQGHWMSRPGRAFVEVIGPPEDMKTVKVGGQAVTVVRGELII
ncbi:MAG: PhzF family phenazine biosynthesis protein [Candidatus Wallbacteria bacterium]|nr:PhzF family phenazine biosynthesis protein [Candidatus Wallbacteria bacterium]